MENIFPAAVLWDFDGTIAETERTWRVGEANIMNRLGLTDTAHLHDELVGQSMASAAAIILRATGRHDLDPADIVRDLTEEVYQLLDTQDPRFQPGVLDLLSEMNQAGIPCAIVSASPRRLIEAFLHHLPEDTFVTVVGDEDVTRGKPHPEPYLTGAQRLGVDPADCLVIEDSPTGAAAGNAAGATVVAVRDTVEVPPADRRVIVDTLGGLSLADLLSLAGTVR